MRARARIEIYKSLFLKLFEVYDYYFPAYIIPVSI